MNDIKKEFFQFFDDGDIEKKVNSAKIIFDTNTLLNMYRYNKKNREKLLEVINSIKDRVILTNQVAFEFLKNRKEEVKNRTTYKKSLQASVSKWTNSFLIDLDEAGSLKRILSNESDLEEKLRQIVQECYVKLETEINDFSEEITSQFMNPNKDLILNEILSVFNFKVREELTDIEKVIDEGKKRYKDKIPPGYNDKFPGDYIIWCEMMEIANNENTDILFVSDDTKPDWMEYKNSIWPRNEIIKEFKVSTGQSFWKITTEKFIDLISELNNIENVEDLKSETEEINTKKSDLIEESNTYHFTVKEIDPDGYEYLFVLKNIEKKLTIFKVIPDLREPDVESIRLFIERNIRDNNFEEYPERNYLYLSDNEGNIRQFTGYRI